MSLLTRLKQNKPKTIIVSAGVLAMLIAIGLFLNGYLEKANWVNTFGTVVSYQKYHRVLARASSSVIYNYYTKMSYVVDGTTYYRTVTESSPPTIGSTRPMSYNPADPYKSSVQHEGQYVIAGIFFAFGLLVTVGGIFAKYDLPVKKPSKKKTQWSKKRKREFVIYYILFPILFLGAIAVYAALTSPN